MGCPLLRPAGLWCWCIGAWWASGRWTQRWTFYHRRNTRVSLMSLSTDHWRSWRTKPKDLTRDVPMEKKGTFWPKTGKISCNALYIFCTQPGLSAALCPTNAAGWRSTEVYTHLQRTSRWPGKYFYVQGYRQCRVVHRDKIHIPSLFYRAMFQWLIGTMSTKK